MRIVTERHKHSDILSMCAFDTFDISLSVSAPAVRQMELFALVMLAAINTPGPEYEAHKKETVIVYKSLIVTPAGEVAEAETHRSNPRSRPMKRIGWMLSGPDIFRPD